MNEPAIIKKLDEVVINRIAAGEVVQRPANALKELIENSLDARSTNIQIVLKSGGLKFMQIQDNGTGIRKEDFDMVCERFTTSKLRDFEDLAKISTYGFRGEALASISHVAHFTVQSKTAHDRCAYRAEYEDGKLKGPVKPIADNPGTRITVEDLFYNMSVRRNVLRSPTEEYQKIADVVGKYAVHNASVGFALKKFGENNDIRTPANSTHIDNIRTVYGNDIARELIELEVEDKEFQFRLKGHMSNVNYSKKKFIFILFINHRLVESQAIKKAIDEVYTNYLPKNAHPFVYLSLELEPSNVDVNIHPTKHEVHFLHEERVVERVAKAVERKLLGSNSSRTFYTQAKLPGFNVETDKTAKNQTNRTVTQDKDLVRTNAQEQKLDKFFGSPVVVQRAVVSQSTVDDSATMDCTPTSSQKSSKTIAKNLPAIAAADETDLTSVLDLRKAIENDCHVGLREVFAQHVFVGSVDPVRAVVQHNTKLFLCDTKSLTAELFYQLALYHFQNLGVIRFTNDLRVEELAACGLKQPEAGWTEEDGPEEELARRIGEILRDKAEMLNDYFSVSVDDDGNLRTIPVLLDDYTPGAAGMAMFVLRLATEVTWDSEKECFETLAREIARYYASDMEDDPNWKWTQEHVLYPAVKKYLLPSKRFAQNGTVLELTDLPSLYKVFERC